MADPRVPIIKYVAATDAGVIADFTAEGNMGAAYIQNRGANPVYVAFDAVPANTNGDGRLLLEADRSLNLDDIFFTTVGFRCTAALTANVEVVGLPRPGSSGMGFG